MIILIILGNEENRRTLLIEQPTHPPTNQPVTHPPIQTIHALGARWVWGFCWSVGLRAFVLTASWDSQLCRHQRSTSIHSRDFAINAAPPPPFKMMMVINRFWIKKFVNASTKINFETVDPSTNLQTKCLNQENS